jgi:hypothetical protein
MDFHRCTRVTTSERDFLKPNEAMLQLLSSNLLGFQNPRSVAEKPATSPFSCAKWVAKSM